MMIAMKNQKMARLILEDGTLFTGPAFGDTFVDGHTARRLC